MKNIVIGIDFSNSSKNAMRHAVAISIRNKAKLHLAWVKTPKIFADIDGGDDATGNYISKANAKLQEWAGMCKQESPDSEVNTIILDGKVHIALLQYAANLPDAIIVMGTHGSSGFEEGYIGNNAYRLINRSSVPVLVMREDINVKRDLYKILTPVDMSFETLQKMKLSIGLAKDFAAQICILGILNHADAEIKHIVNVQVNNAIKMCRKAGVRHAAISMETNMDACHVVLDYAEEIDANLIVIMREESDSYFTASAIMRSILTTSRRPLMIVPNVNVFSLSR